jgi:hypothetical protein
MGRRQRIALTVQIPSDADEADIGRRLRLVGLDQGVFADGAQPCEAGPRIGPAIKAAVNDDIGALKTIPCRAAARVDIQVPPDVTLP